MANHPLTITQLTTCCQVRTKTGIVRLSGAATPSPSMASGPRADQEHHCCQSRRKPVQRKKKLGKLVSEKCCHQRERAAFTNPTCHQGKTDTRLNFTKEWCCVGLLYNRTRLAAAGAPRCPETKMGAHGAASNHRDFPLRKQTNIAILMNNLSL